jgi:hypothetical protein
MENLSTLEIIGIIVLVLVFGGLILRLAARLFKYFLIVLLIFAGIYFVKPELLNEWFGDGTTNQIEQKVGDVLDDAKPHVKEGVKKIDEALDSIENKL